MILKIIIKNWNKLLVASTLITFGFAQTSEQLELVLEINPEVRAAEKAYQAALEKIKVSGALPDPMIEGSFSISAIETRNGPVENQLMIGQKFPLWGKLKRERSIERIKAEISRLNLVAAKVKASFLLRKNLANYIKQSESLIILEEYRKELDIFQSIAQSQYSNGMGLTQHSIIKLQIEESLVVTKINELESALSSTVNDLQILYNGHFVPSQVNHDFKLKINSLSEKYWTKKVSISSPIYSIAQAQVAVASDQYKLSKLKNYPDLLVGMTYSLVGSTDLGGAVSAGEDAMGFKFGINIPLWFGKNKARVKSALYTQKRYEELLSDTWNKVEYDILSRIKDLSETNDTYKLYDESIIYETEQMLSSAYAAYETGEISFLDLLDSIRLGVKVRIEFEGIKAKQTILIAEIYRSAGIINSTQEKN